MKYDFDSNYAQLPYFDGDFWPGMIENVLREMKVREAVFM